MHTETPFVPSSKVLHNQRPKHTLLPASEAGNENALTADLGILCGFFCTYVYTSVCVYLCAYDQYVHMYACVYVYVHVCTCARTYMYLKVHIHAYAYVHACILYVRFCMHVGKI